MIRLLLFAVLAAAPYARFAHAAESVTKYARAADASERVPDTRYDSAFTGYQPFREQKLAPWRELNDDVHKAGGHGGIFGGIGGGTAAKPAAQHPPEHKK